MLCCLGRWPLTARIFQDDLRSLFQSIKTDGLLHSAPTMYDAEAIEYDMDDIKQCSEDLNTTLIFMRYSLSAPESLSDPASNVHADRLYCGGGAPSTVIGSVVSSPLFEQEQQVQEKYKGVVSTIASTSRSATKPLTEQSQPSPYLRLPNPNTCFYPIFSLLSSSQRAPKCQSPRSSCILLLLCHGPPKTTTPLSTTRHGAVDQ